MLFEWSRRNGGSSAVGGFGFGPGSRCVCQGRGDYGPAASPEPADAPSMPRDYSVGNWGGTRYYAPSTVYSAPAMRSFSYAPAPQQAQPAPAKPAALRLRQLRPRPGGYSYQAAPTMMYRAPVSTWPHRIGPLHSADAKALFNY